MKRILKTIISIALLVVTIALPVMASGVENVDAQSFDISLETNRAVLNPGNEVVVAVKVTNFSAIESLQVVGGILEYNADILELVEVTGLSDNGFNKANSTFISDKVLNANDTILNAKFKVKEGITVPVETTVGVSSIEGSAGNGDIYPVSKNIGLRIIERGISSEEYIIDGNLITSVAPNTTAATFKSKIQAKQTITVKDKNGATLADSAVVATGMKLVTEHNVEYTIVVRGDIDGNGIVTANDMSLFKAHYVGLKSLTGIALKAADCDVNGRTTANDLSQMKLIFVQAD